MKESKISHRQLIKKEDAIVYLENMITSLKSGKIVIERNGQFVSLSTPDLMSMELTAKGKKDKNELSIEFSWRKEPFVPDIAQLNISSDEPGEPEEEMEKEETAEAKDTSDKAEGKKTEKTDTPVGAEKPDAGASKSPAHAAKTAPKAPAKTK